MGAENIIVRGGREHNLKNISLDIPRDKLVVFTGVSGSGKSSLAFDTIYAEGQRRYVESLSAYARQFLGQMEKPKVDFIGGLSPAISIEQKSASKNPRSTVGTITEIYDYLRLLYARVGVQHCHQCGEAVGAQALEQIVDRIMGLDEGSRFLVLGPRVRERKGEYREIFEQARQDGFVRVRVNGRVYDLEEDIRLDKKMKHTIEIVVDRLVMKAGVRSRLSDSVEKALEIGDGLVVIQVVEGEEILFSEEKACLRCGISFAELAPQNFSFNSPLGRCEVCDGLGRKLEFDPELVVPNEGLSIREGAIHPWKTLFDRNRRGYWSRRLRQGLRALAKQYEFSLDDPWSKLTKRQRTLVLFGCEQVTASGVRRWKVSFPGVIPQLERWWEQSNSESFRQWCMEAYMSQRPCAACEGGRLRPESAAVGIGGKTIVEVTRLSVDRALAFFERVELSDMEREIAGEVLKEVIGRLRFLTDVGLHYLTLERAAPSLSGGEGQRIRLASQIGSGLVGVLYILDEPSIGLHQRDNGKLLDTLCRLRDLGNTVIVVEHDLATMQRADWLVDFGPGAGRRGGEVVVSGPRAEVEKEPRSVTGRYLTGKATIPIPRCRRKPNRQWLRVLGAAENNLKNIDVRIPLGVFTCVTGVSGSGKSSLINEILYKALAQKINRAHTSPGAYRRIHGSQHLDRVIDINQQPIGRTPRSNPATYTKAFDAIRQLFAQLPEARLRGYKPGRFSFNVRGGRCEACQGAGVKRIEMHFLADVFVTCDVCKGLRFNRETLQVRYKGKNISEVLNLTVAEALELFENHPRIVRVLRTVADVGLDYIPLGQPAPTLSGGEAQRVKLARELCKVDTSQTLYSLDEPTTGLHFDDIRKLLHVLDRLVERGNTVVVIEHNLDVIKCADYIVDLGPEGGDFGGEVVATGTPEKVAEVEESYTGQFLAEMLNGRRRPRRRSRKK
jgi:excinuclease ABC subunit A